jgi:iron(III) transport system ATP-binding protein
MVDAVILQLDNVTKQFGQTPVINQVTLDLRPGELLTLLGRSGCGKTTLLRLIAGFATPDQGTITITGRRVAGSGHWVAPEQRGVGMVFQDYALFPHLTVAENIAFGLRRQQPMREIVSTALALIGLTGLERRYPHELSGGQQQRVALARALAPQPSLILLDEPLSNLDVQTRLRLRQEIREILKKANTAAIFVTHDQEEAAAISDRIAVMHQGQIAQWDSPEAIYHTPASRFVAEFVTQANFLPARYQDEQWSTELGPLPLRLPPPASTSPEPPTIMIRQHDLHLDPDPQGQAVIRDRQFLGREHRYILITDQGQQLQALSTLSPPVAVGTRVKLSCNPAQIQVFG